MHTPTYRETCSTLHSAVRASEPMELASLVLLRWSSTHFEMTGSWKHIEVCVPLSDQHTRVKIYGEYFIACCVFTLCSSSSLNRRRGIKKKWKSLEISTQNI